MTDFASVYVAGTERAVFVAERSSALYAALSIGYVCAGAGAVCALSRLCVTHPQRKNAVLVVTHALVLAVALLRALALLATAAVQYDGVAVSTLSAANSGGSGGSSSATDGALSAVVSTAVLGIVSALPYVALFWTFTVVIFFWTAITGFSAAIDVLPLPTTPTANSAVPVPGGGFAVSSTALPTGDGGALAVSRAFASIRCGFVAGNVFVTALVLGLYAALIAVLPSASSSSSSADTSGSSIHQTLAVIGLCVVGCVTLDFGCSFALNASQLWNAVNAVQRTSTDPCPPHITRLFRIAVAMGLAFVAQALVLFSAAITIDSFTSRSSVLNGLYYALDLLCLVLVIALFWPVVADGYERRRHDRAAVAYHAQIAGLKMRHPPVPIRVNVPGNSSGSGNGNGGAASGVNLILSARDRESSSRTKFQGFITTAGASSSWNPAAHPQNPSPQHRRSPPNVPGAGGAGFAATASAPATSAAASNANSIAVSTTVALTTGQSTSRLVRVGERERDRESPATVGGSQAAAAGAAPTVMSAPASASPHSPVMAVRTTVATAVGVGGPIGRFPPSPSSGERVGFGSAFGRYEAPSTAALTGVSGAAAVSAGPASANAGVMSGGASSSTLLVPTAVDPAAPNNPGGAAVSVALGAASTGVTNAAGVTGPTDASGVLAMRRSPSGNSVAALARRSPSPRSPGPAGPQPPAPAQA